MVRFDSLSIDQIDVGEGIRQTLDKEPLDELAASIKLHGILQPLVVEPGDEGRYKLQIGKRRMAAAKMVGLEKVPAIVLEGPLNPEDSLAIRLVENLHREDLDPIDEAEAFAKRARARNLVKALAAVVDEGCFNVDESRISLIAMDSSNIAMVDFELPGAFFDEYRCDGEQRIFINIGEFLKFLDRVERDERVKIRLEEDRARLVIQCIRPGHSRRFMMTILEPLDEEVPQPKIFFMSSARILTGSLRQAFRDAGLVSEHVKIEVTGDMLKMGAVGDVGSAFSEWERGADELLELRAEEESGANFTLSYLMDITNAVGVSSEVATLELTTDMPLRMEFELPQGKLVYYLAPMIGA